MSARKAIAAIAKKKNLTLMSIAKNTGYNYLHHFQRALDHSSSISAKRVMALSKALDENPESILRILTRN